MVGTILGCIYGAIDEANLDRDGGPPLAKSEATEIYGSADGLDSLGLINFVVAVEENLEREFGVEVTLSDERTMSQEPSPLKTVGALAGHLQQILSESGVPDPRSGS